MNTSTALHTKTMQSWAKGNTTALGELPCGDREILIRMDEAGMPIQVRGLKGWRRKSSGTAMRSCSAYRLDPEYPKKQKRKFSMTPAKYLKQSGVCESPTFLPDAVPTVVQHGIDGIASEAGELVDAKKKSLYYGNPLDIVNIKEELGDICWYIAQIMRHYDWTWEEIWDANIKKLKVRYPEQFTQEHAVNRDLNAERAALEGGDENGA